jgi:hypothetical protein
MYKTFQIAIKINKKTKTNVYLSNARILHPTEMYLQKRQFVFLAE